MLLSLRPSTALDVSVLNSWHCIFKTVWVIQFFFFFFSKLRKLITCPGREWLQGENTELADNSFSRCFAVCIKFSAMNFKASGTWQGYSCPPPHCEPQPSCIWRQLLEASANPVCFMGVYKVIKSDSQSAETECRDLKTDVYRPKSGKLQSFLSTRSKTEWRTVQSALPPGDIGPHSESAGQENPGLEYSFSVSWSSFQMHTTNN